MKILLTGATGYIGKRLLPHLIAQGHTVVCCVRDRNKFYTDEAFIHKIQVVEVDLTQEESLKAIPQDIDCAYYLVHSMSTAKDFSELEKQSAIHFRNALNKTKAKQLIYLSGIVNSHTLSEHLNSRKTVELELSRGNYALTTLRAGIIIGSGSASFEIIRDLVEKLPIMIGPRWLNTRCQPIGISDVIQCLIGVLGNNHTYNKGFDIAGPDILSYKEMLLNFAQVRGLKRKIWTVPVMTPKLSSYWLYFITSTSFKLAMSLVDSMKIEVIAKDNEINALLNLKPLSYQSSILRAFQNIEHNEIISSWKDSTVSGRLDFKISDHILVPEQACFKDVRKQNVSHPDECIEKIWKIGGETGWYCANGLWKLRGFIDKMCGGVGLNRGRTHLNQIHAGDSIDFWRVLYANKEEMRLILFAEMKLPGEAWLEFKVQNGILIQTATFRPKGLFGRAYWYSVLPFHAFIFKGLIKELTRHQS
jgi:uncharacterized protein YbjT (DUF2867 family)